MKIEVRIQNQSHDIECSPTETILDAAIKNELNPPYSCMEGVCSSCIATILQGEVQVDEVRAGKILTCQAKPKEGSGPLVISYDTL